MGLNIALGRALNVGGRTASSAGLKALFTALGCMEIKTVLQTGNVLYSGECSPLFCERLAAAFEAQFGYAADFYLREPAEWRTMLSANPFLDAAGASPQHLLVYILAHAPERAKVEALRESWTGPETLEVRGREAFVVYPDGVGDSKMTPALLERRLGVRGTARNWNTALKIAALAGAMP